MVNAVVALENYTRSVKRFQEELKQLIGNALHGPQEKTMCVSITQASPSKGVGKSKQHHRLTYVQ